MEVYHQLEFSLTLQLLIWKTALTLKQTQTLITLTQLPKLIINGKNHQLVRLQIKVNKRASLESSSEKSKRKMK